MKLQEFVKETLIQVIEGVRNAQGMLSEKDGAINPRALSLSGPIHNGRELQHVDFDVAVTVIEESGVSGRISVFGIGAKGGASEENSTVSRIKFKVPVGLPSGNK